MRYKIPIQGYDGSFHDVAARIYFGNEIEIVPCDTFRKVVQSLSEDDSYHAAVMAIENSIAGSILPNYNLLQQSDLRITGEIYLHIKQHLLVNKGATIGNIKEVHSHYMAFLQCADFLDNHKFTLIESEDTALSAAWVAESGRDDVAAIGSDVAAEKYNLEILCPDIHTLKFNVTRFLILSRTANHIRFDDSNKASIHFHIDNSKGSLARVLIRIASSNVNLTKLQSFPVPGTDFKYGFHADLEFDSLDDFYNALDSIKPVTEDIIIYGTFKKGEKIKIENL